MKLWSNFHRIFSAYNPFQTVDSSFKFFLFLFFLYYFSYLYRVDIGLVSSFDPERWFSLTGTIISILSLLIYRKQRLLTSILYFLLVLIYFYFGQMGVEHTSHTSLYFIFVFLSPIVFFGTVKRSTLSPLLVFLAIFYTITAFDKLDAGWLPSGDVLLRISELPGFTTQLGSVVFSLKLSQIVFAPLVVAAEFFLGAFALIGLIFPAVRRLAGFGIVLVHGSLLFLVDVGPMPLIFILLGIFLILARDKNEDSKNISFSFWIKSILTVFAFFLIPPLVCQQNLNRYVKSLVDWSFMSNPSVYIKDVDIFYFSDIDDQPRLFFSGRNQTNSIISAFATNEGPIARHMYLRLILSTKRLDEKRFSESNFGQNLVRFCGQKNATILKTVIDTIDGQHTFYTKCR